jgi:hypothetical protein
LLLHERILSKILFFFDDNDDDDGGVVVIVVEFNCRLLLVLIGLDCFVFESTFCFKFFDFFRWRGPLFL